MTHSLSFFILFCSKRENIIKFHKFWLFPRIKQECWQLWQILDFWEKFWWLLVTVVSEENDMKATTKQDLSHSNTAIQSEPRPRHDAELETYQLHNCEERRGHFTPKFLKWSWAKGKIKVMVVFLMGQLFPILIVYIYSLFNSNCCWWFVSWFPFAFVENFWFEYV